MAQTIKGLKAKPENIHLVLEPLLWGGCLKSRLKGKP